MHRSMHHQSMALPNCDVTCPSEAACQTQLRDTPTQAV